MEKQLSWEIFILIAAFEFVSSSLHRQIKHYPAETQKK